MTILDFVLWCKEHDIPLDADIAIKGVEDEIECDKVFDIGYRISVGGHMQVRAKTPKEAKELAEKSLAVDYNNDFYVSVNYTDRDTIVLEPEFAECSDTISVDFVNDTGERFSND